jgi:hypothetical protein
MTARCDEARWFYLGKRCNVVAVIVENKQVNALRIETDEGMVTVNANDEGEFDGVQYESGESIQ